MSADTLTLKREFFDYERFYLVVAVAFLINKASLNFFNYLAASQAVSLQLLSSRMDDQRKTRQTTENLISFLVCPPPPKTRLVLFDFDSFWLTLLQAPGCIESILMIFGGTEVFSVKVTG